MQQSLNQYLLRVGIFLALVFIVVVLLYPVLQNAFLSNIFINLIILAGLAIGIIFNLIRLIGLNADYIALANFEINKSPKSFLNNNGNLKNISGDLKQIDGLMPSIFYPWAIASPSEIIKLPLYQPKKLCVRSHLKPCIRDIILNVYKVNLHFCPFASQ